MSCESTGSCDMRRVERDWSTWTAETRPVDGEFQIFEKGEQHEMVMMLPGQNFCRIPIRIGPKIEGAWQWDGNRDRPTLTPSVFQHAGSGAQRIDIWHGYVRAGRMVSC